jgi:hypothetical protein
MQNRQVCRRATFRPVKSVATPADRARQESITVLIAPSGFKESLSAQEVTAAISAGVLRAMPGAHTLSAPIVDGGEGFTQALVEATGGTLDLARSRA